MSIFKNMNNYAWACALALGLTTPGLSSVNATLSGDQYNVSLFVPSINYTTGSTVTSNPSFTDYTHSLDTVYLGFNIHVEWYVDLYQDSGLDYIYISTNGIVPGSTTGYFQPDTEYTISGLDWNPARMLTGLQFIQGDLQGLSGLVLTGSSFKITQSQVLINSPSRYALYQLISEPVQAEIPEPSTYALLGSALGIVALAKRRRVTV